MNDTEIIDLFLSRNEQAIAECRRKYGKRLRGIASGILSDDHYAEECENDAYLRAWNVIPPYEPRTYLYAFLARIIRGIALDKYESKSFRDSRSGFCELTSEIEESIPDGEAFAGEVDSGRLSELLSEFLRKQNADSRNVFVRRYWFSESVRTIALKYGFSESKVKTILFRTRRDLRSFLEKEGYRL